jgi:flagellar protein FlbD
MPPMREVRLAFMIELTRLNGSKFSVNCDLIKYFEAAPDTTLTLVTGEKLLVVETCRVVAERAVAYRAEVLRSAWPDAAIALSAKSGYEAYLAACDRGDNSSGSANRG